MEPSVLRGGKDLMTRRAVSHILKAGTSIPELYETIVGLGYLPFELRPDGSLGARSAADLSRVKLCDILLEPALPGPRVLT